jgi:hypothetical protein
MRTAKQKNQAHFISPSLNNKQLKKGGNQIAP